MSADRDDGRRRKWLDRRLTAWLSLVFGLAVTLFAYVHVERERRAVSRERFELLAHQARGAIAQRMGDYAQVLRGLGAHFGSSDDVDRASFHAYVEDLALDRYLPGIQGVGYAPMFSASEAEAVEASVRREGFEEFAIYPPGAREPTSAIVFIEPFDARNQRAFGFDMYSDPVRRAAMDRARDTGQPALSGRVRLVQEAGRSAQPGFLLYSPVYRTGAPTGSIAERRAALRGFVYSPFRAFDLLGAIFEARSSDVEIELFDAASGHALYDSGLGARRPELTADLPMEIAGHRWIARFHSSAAFEASRASAQPALVAFGGGALSLLLFVTLHMNARHRRRMAETSAELAQSRDQLHALVENIPGTVFRARLSEPREIEHLSVGIESLTGLPRGRYLSGELRYDDVIHPEDAERVRATQRESAEERVPYLVEYRIARADGELRWVAERGRPVVDAAGTPRWLDGVVLDIDDRKRAELAVTEMAFHDPLTGLPNRRLLLERLEHQLAVAERTRRIGALLYLDLDRFKAINDSLGHEAGDALLVEVARRLEACLREVDTVARMGGDEFVALIEDVGPTRVEAEQVTAGIAEKITAALNRPVSLAGGRCTATPSVGAALFSGREASPELVLRRADEAMYAAKSAGRNRVRFYGELPEVRA